jgi:FkbM family methyltransferase
VDHWFHAYRPGPGDVIIDVGAGIGSETVLFSQAVGPAGLVYAIEAHPNTFRCLRAVCKWNHLQNVRPCHHAIMDRRGTFWIEDNVRHDMNTVAPTPERPQRVRPVSGIPLDEFCDAQRIGHVDFLKMNIEGAEHYAIAGMTKTIGKTRYVCIACHDCRGERFRTKRLVLDFLQAHGFDTVTRDDHPRAYVRDHVHGINRRCQSERAGECVSATESPTEPVNATDPTRAGAALADHAEPACRT